MAPSHEYRHAHQAQHDIFFRPMDAIKHKRAIIAACTTFVLDKSDGFTQTGMTRLNDSIRTFVWVIIESQAVTRSDIFDA